MSAKASDVKAAAKDKVTDVNPELKKDPPKSDVLSPVAGVTEAAKVPAMGAAPPAATQASDTQADDAAPIDEGEGAVLVGKLSPKEVMGINFRDEIMSGRMKLPCQLYTLIGRAENLRDGESDFGPWTAARGEFEAVRIHDNKTFMGRECHVPGPAGEMLVEEVRKLIVAEIPATAEQVKKRGKTYTTSGGSVDLALVVGIKATTRAGGQPYEFTVASLIPVRRSDALAAMRQKALAALRSVPASQRLALPAPTPHAEPAK